MADKKRSIRLPILMIILVELIGGLIASIICCGCASQPHREDSNQTKVEQGYPCPSCGHRIDMTNINQNIRMGNTCPSCGKTFFYTPVAESSKEENYQRGYGNYGPRNYGPTSVYQSDVDYQRFGVGWYSFKETPYGFSELSGYFQDSKVKSYRVTPHWTTKRYHLVGR